MNNVMLNTFCIKLEEIRLEKKIVFTNGCFDLFHYGHLEFLVDAKSKGDILIVGLNSDLSIKRIKNKYRPIINEIQRFKILNAIRYVDYVILFEEDTPIELIEKIKPDVLVKGGDYKEGEVVGADYVRRYGGEVFITPLVAGVSTSQIIEKIISYDLYTKFT